MSKGFGPYLQNAFGDSEKECYFKTHFDCFGFCTGSLNKTLRSRNVIGHVRNNYVKAINDHVLLPKFVILVLENDIIKAANHYRGGSDLVFQPLIDWITLEFHRSTTEHKERLPTKSRKFKYPQLLWLLPVLHKNFEDNYY